MNRLPTCLLAATLFLGSASLYAEDPACAASGWPIQAGAISR